MQTRGASAYKEACSPAQQAEHALLLYNVYS